jgi:hypothetical protein
MNRTRSHKDRNRHKLARAFMTNNMSEKTLLQQQEDFNLGLKVETGTLEETHDVIKAMEILDELVAAGRVTKDHVDNIKMDLAMKLSGLKIVSHIK